MHHIAAIIAAIVVGTWNGNWFPSGRAEHRAHPDVEAATSRAAAKMLSDGLASVDPEGTNDVILVLNEIRGPRSASNLVAQIGRKGLSVASISAYRRRDRFDQQQDVIATTLPVAAKGWSVWKNHKKETPPRGYAFASLVLSPAVTATVFAVHLKSNYGATTEEIRELNRAKRLHAAEQLAKQTSRDACAVVAGDMNADPWRKEFAKDAMFDVFAAAGFANLMSLAPPEGRGTHPHRRYGDSCLDHILCKGLSVVSPPKVVPNDSLSDHYAVFAVIDAVNQPSGSSGFEPSLRLGSSRAKPNPSRGNMH